MILLSHHSRSVDLDIQLKDLEPTGNILKKSENSEGQMLATDFCSAGYL